MKGEGMFRLLRSISAVFFIVIFTFSLCQAAECNSRCCEEEYPKLIVQGKGKIEVQADKAYFNIKVRVEENKLERAFEQSSKKINSLQEVLVSQGVKKEDIRNLGYVYHPLYEGKKIFTTIDRPSSYEVIYALRITAYNLDNLGKILLKFSEIPETTVYGLEYTSTKIEELKREVLKEASADARQRALKLAEGAGAILGKVLKIESGTEAYPLQRQEYNLEEGIADRSVNKRELSVPQIESGHLEITGNCTVYYSIQ
jgi:uncharacterized protein YggE